MRAQAEATQLELEQSLQAFMQLEASERKEAIPALCELTVRLNALAHGLGRLESPCLLSVLTTYRNHIESIASSNTPPTQTSP